MARNNAPSLMAGGDIYPNRFVKLSTAADNKVLQAGANDVVIGISQPGNLDNRSDASSSLAASTTYPQVEVAALGDVYLLEAGTGGWTRGDALVSDSNGKGVVANGPGQNVGAYALESATAGEKRPVQIILKGGFGDGPITTASADGAVSALSGTVFVTKAGVCAMTIANPTATTDDGKTLTFVATTAYAHTLTYGTTGFNSSGTAQDVATFGGARGDSITIRAYQGIWYATNTQNVTLG